MSVRDQLVDALKNVPVVINGFWYTADEFEALGFSAALVAAMKDTTNNRAVNALIQGLLVSTTYRTKGRKALQPTADSLEGAGSLSNSGRRRSSHSNVWGKISMAFAFDLPALAALTSL